MCYNAKFDRKFVRRSISESVIEFTQPKKAIGTSAWQYQLLDRSKNAQNQDQFYVFLVIGLKTPEQTENMRIYDLNLGSNYAIEIVPTLTRQISTNSNPCNDFAHRLSCGIECTAKTHKKLYRCQVAFNMDRTGVDPNTCNFFDIILSENSSVNSKTLEYSNNYDNCLRSCKSPCDRWHYDVSIRNTFDYRDMNMIRIVFSLPNKLDLIIFEQMPTYNVHSFISNIGGQISLWCGASIISLVHVGYFFIRVCCEKCNRKYAIEITNQIP